MVLTDRQRAELDAAVHSYLQDSGYREAADIMREQYRRHHGSDMSTTDADVLGRRWTAVSSLQHEVLELTEALARMEAELNDRPRTKPKRPLDYTPLVQSKFILRGHRAQVTCAAFHPSYSLLASSSQDGTIKVWDCDTGVCESTLRGHTDAVHCVCFETSDGQLLASAGGDNTVRIWRYDQLRPSSSSCIRTLTGHADVVSCCAFVSNGDAIVTCSRDNTIRQWDLATGYCTVKLINHTEWIKALDVSSSRLISCSLDKNVYVWSNKEVVATLRGHEHVIECIASCPSWRVYKHLSVNNSVAENLRGGFESYSKQCEKAGGTAGANMLVATGGRDRIIRLYDLRSHNNTMPVLELTGHDGWIRSIHFHPHGRYIISAADDGTVRQWDLTNSDVVTRRVSEQPLSCVRMHCSLPVMCVSGADACIRLYECE